MKMTNDIKIPSVISYSPRTSNNELQFGADLSPEAVAMVHTKMELDVQETRLDELDLIIQVLDGMKNLNFEHIKASKGMPEYTWKTPEEVVTDYLKKVFKPFWDATDYLGHLRELITVDVVITVPVVSRAVARRLPNLITPGLVVSSAMLNLEGGSQRRLQRNTLPTPEQIPDGD